MVNRWFVTILTVLTLGWMTGCVTPNDQPPRQGGNGLAAGTNASANLNPLAVGDKVTVTFQDINPAIPAIDTAVKEDGTITLTMNLSFTAAGKTIAQLESDIRERYVPRIYRYMTPTVRVQDRYFSVGGEVRSPNRQLYISKMTVLKAIDAAGGFTDFGNQRSVVVIRADGKRFTEDCKAALAHPEKDQEVFPGDQVFVKKRWW